MLLLDAFEYFEQAVEWASNDGALSVWLLIWGVLFASGLGAPLPEDIPLTLAGFLTFRAGFFGQEPGLMAFSFPDYVATFLFVTSAILVGDSCCWWLGKRFGLPLRNRIGFFKRILSDHRLNKVHGWFTRFGGATVFLGRQVAGVRFVTFFTAGVVRMPLPKFIFWDFIGSLVSVPIWLSLGGFGSRYQDDLENWIRNTSVGFLVAVVLAVVIFVAYVKYLRKRKAATPTPDSTPDLSAPALAVEEEKSKAEIS